MTYSRIFFSALVITLALATVAPANSQTQPVSVTIFTKDIPPLSDAGQGFAIDFLIQVLRDTYGRGFTYTVIVVADNNEIIRLTNEFNAAHGNSETVYALGTAAISFTDKRFNITNYLPPWYTDGGLRVMTHTFNSRWTKFMTIFRNFWIAAGALLALAITIVLIIFSLACCLEFLTLPKNKVPLFVNFKIRMMKRKDGPPPTVTLYGLFAWEWVKQKWSDRVLVNKTMYLLATELYKSLNWALHTVANIKTAYPESRGARIIHSLGKVIAVLFLVVGTATITTVFTVSASSTTINSFDDLGGTRVGTVAGTTSYDYVVAKNFGFEVEIYASVAMMFINFWLGKVDAVVYDNPALQDALSKHGGGAVVVGDALTKDSYGIVITHGHPLTTVLSRGVVALTTNVDAYLAIQNQWIRETDGGESGSGSVKWGLIIGSIIAVIVGLVVLVIIPLYRRYDALFDTIKENINRKMDDQYADDLEILLEEEYNNHVTDDVDLLTRIMFKLVMRNSRLAMEQNLNDRGIDARRVGAEHRPAYRVDTSALGNGLRSVSEDGDAARALRAPEMEGPGIDLESGVQSPAGAGLGEDEA